MPKIRIKCSHILRVWSKYGKCQWEIRNVWSIILEWCIMFVLQGIAWYTLSDDRIWEKFEYYKVAE